MTKPPYTRFDNSAPGAEERVVPDATLPERAGHLWALKW